MSSIQHEAAATLATASRSPLQALLYEALTPHELPRMLFRSRQLRREPRGNGEAVMVLPGYGLSDLSTSLLRSYLNYLGYRAVGWGLGRNSGHSRDHLPQLLTHINELESYNNGPVPLIGWSIGGYIAREVASLHPQKIRQVITLGSPITGGPKYTAFAKHLRQSGTDLNALEQHWNQRQQQQNIQVPVTAIFSRRDGIVAWQACVDQSHNHIEHVEVKTSHLGLGYSPEVYSIIARRLAEKSFA